MPVATFDCRGRWRTGGRRRPTQGKPLDHLLFDDGGDPGRTMRQCCGSAHAAGGNASGQELVHAVTAWCSGPPGGVITSTAGRQEAAHSRQGKRRHEWRTRVHLCVVEMPHI